MAASRPVRQWLLLAHVVASLGWLGSGAANLVLAVTALTTGAPDLSRACYQLINRLDFALVIPLAFAALATGLLSSLATKWGLLRHWWVLVKFALTIAVIVFSTFGVGVWVEQNMTATSTGQLGPTRTDPVAEHALVVGAAANIVAFLFMTWASIRKPWPRTPWTTTSTRWPRQVAPTPHHTSRPSS